MKLERLAAAVAAARAAGADEAEASYEGGVLGMTRFAGSYLTQSGVVVEGRTRVRAAVGGRIGAVTTGAPDPESLAAAARRAVEIAREVPALEGFDGFARPVASGPAARFVEATAAAGPVERADLVGRLFARAAADGLACAGSFVTGPTERAVVTSGGVAVEERGTRALLELIALDGRASGHSLFHGPDASALDPEALADEACRAAVRGRTVTELAPAAMDVVLAPAAVAEALEWMAATGFSGRTLVDGTSLLVGRRGERLCAAEVTIRDDAGHVHPRALPQGFDAEGTPKRAVSFIEAGVAGQAITDRATAHKLGGGSTGHAPGVRDDMSEGPVAANLVMLPGDATVADLVGRVERGLFVSRFHYVNGLLDTRRAGMTGMTRDGTFLIENGRLGPAVPNLRWTESFLEAFGRLGGVGRELACLPARWTLGPGAVLCPALLVRAFRFTGLSRG